MTASEIADQVKASKAVQEARAALQKAEADYVATTEVGLRPFQQLKFRIEVAVTLANDSLHVTPLINRAIDELVNRADFRSGSIGNGRVLTYSPVFGESVVTIDLSHEHIDLSDDAPGELCARVVDKASLA